VLESVAAKGSEVAKKIEGTAAFQTMSAKIKSLGALLSSKASVVASEAGKRVDEQVEAEKH
jgi:hypothetical protein